MYNCERFKQYSREKKKVLEIQMLKPSFRSFNDFQLEFAFREKIEINSRVPVTVIVGFSFYNA